MNIMRQYLVTFLRKNHKTYRETIIEAYNSIVAKMYVQYLLPDAEEVTVDIAVPNYTNPCISVHKFPTITEEMINKVHTDSDLEDLAAELNVPIVALDLMFSNEAARGTACFGCDNITMRGNSARCHCCSRGRTDNYINMI